MWDFFLGGGVPHQSLPHQRAPAQRGGFWGINLDLQLSLHLLLLGLGRFP